MSERVQQGGDGRGRYWVAGGLLAGVVLVTAMRAADGQRPAPDKKEAGAPAPAAAPKAEAPPQDDLLAGQFELMHGMIDALQRTQARGAPDLADLAPVMNRMLQLQHKHLEQMRKMGPPAWATDADQARLGARCDAPEETLAEQLDLPRGQGLVVGPVAPGSAAAKAGLLANDVLLELDGKPVPREREAFLRALAETKPDVPIDVVVLRKGMKQTVKGLSLPQAPAAGAPGFGPPENLPGLPQGAGFPRGPGLPNRAGPPFGPRVGGLAPVGLGRGRANP
jgi:membrane-associated protease RseP (regulator of RpoE activity)